MEINSSIFYFEKKAEISISSQVDKMGSKRRRLPVSSMSKKDCSDSFSEFRQAQYLDLSHFFCPCGEEKNSNSENYMNSKKVHVRAAGKGTCRDSQIQNAGDRHSPSSDILSSGQEYYGETSSIISVGQINEAAKCSGIPRPDLLRIRFASMILKSQSQTENLKKDYIEAVEKEKLKLKRKAARIAIQRMEDMCKKQIFDDYQFYMDLEKLGIYSTKDNPLRQLGRY